MTWANNASFHLGGGRVVILFRHNKYYSLQLNILITAVVFTVAYSKWKKGEENLLRKPW